jgi:hypothetical protein
MDLYDFYNTFFTAAATDAELITWAHINFDRAHKVLVDFYVDDPPAAADRPYILFHTPGHEKDQTQRINRYYIGTTLVISTNDLTLRAESGLEEPSGMELILDFMTHLQRLIAAACPAHFSVGFSAAADTMVTDTEVVAEMDMAFDEVVTIGTSPLT